MPGTSFFIFINLIALASIIQTTAGRKVSRRRLFAAVAVYAVGMFMVYHVMHYPFPDVIRHWVRTDDFQLSN